MTIRIGTEDYSTDTDSVFPSVKVEAFTKLGEVEVSATVFLDVVGVGGQACVDASQMGYRTVVWVGQQKFGLNLPFHRLMPKSGAVEYASQELAAMLRRMRAE